jgi:hypothetical protein
MEDFRRLQERAKSGDRPHGFVNRFIKMPNFEQAPAKLK